MTSKNGAAACRKAIVEQVNQLIEAYIHLAALPASSDVGTDGRALLLLHAILNTSACRAQHRDQQPVTGSGLLIMLISISAHELQPSTVSNWCCLQPMVWLQHVTLRKYTSSTAAHVVEPDRLSRSAQRSRQLLIVPLLYCEYVRAGCRVRPCHSQAACGVRYVTSAWCQW